MPGPEQPDLTDQGEHPDHNQAPPGFVPDEEAIEPELDVDVEED